MRLEGWRKSRPSRGAILARVAPSVRPRKKRGRRECRVFRPTRSLACMKKAHECSHHRYAEQSGIPRAAGFNGFLRGLPGDRAFLPPSPRNAKHCHRVDTSVEISVARFRSSCATCGPHFHELRKQRATATLIPVPLAILKFLKGVAANSGGTSKSAALVRHDFAVRLVAARLSARRRPPHPAPDVRDDREAPLLVGRDANRDIAASTPRSSNISDFPKSAELHAPLPERRAHCNGSVATACPASATRGGL
jgi:hypothetical protein